MGTPFRNNEAVGERADAGEFTRWRSNTHSLDDCFEIIKNVLYINSK